MPSSKSKTKLKYRWTFEAIGTYWEVSTNKSLQPTTKQKISTYIEQFDRQLSRFRADSLIAKLSKQKGSVGFNKSLIPLFEWYEELEKQTEGMMTPTIGEVIAGAGYDATYTLNTKQIPKPARAYRSVVKRSGAILKVAEPILLDYGAAGKGFLVDAVYQILQEDHHTDFVVDGSGDIRHASKNVSSETIGLQDPNDKGKVIGVVSLSNKALCASAVTGRAWGDWHHVINAQTAQPVYEIIATWVIADSAMIADGLATALFFVSAQKLTTQYTYEYLRLHKDGSIEGSDYFLKGVFS